MIEASVLAALAASRYPCVVTPREGAPDVLALVLWREPPTVENKLQRDDAWRVIFHPTTIEPVSAIIFASDAEAVEGVLPAVPPVDMAAPQAHGSCAFVEAAALACFLGLRVSFAYRKVAGGAPEARRGKALGTKGPLLFLEDADRASDAAFLAAGIRRLTVLECAALQDMPPDYPWRGTKTAKYRQVGNGVPPSLARAVAGAVARAAK